MNTPQLIHKYTLNGQNTTLDLPTNAKFLAVQEQRDEIVLWFIFDPQCEQKEERAFYVRGTGERFVVEDLEGFTYLGTVQTRSMRVWHIFEQQ